MDLSFITQIRDIPLLAGPDGLTVVAGPGLAYLPDGTRMRSAGASAIFPSPPANGWWYAYGYPADGGLMGLELSQTPPDAPYLVNGTARCKQGDSTRRYLSQGLVVNNKLRPAIHLQAASKGNLVLFDQSAETFTVPASLLTISANVATPVVTSLAGVVPANATAVRLQINNLTNGTLYLQRGSLAGAGTPVSATNRQIGVQANNSIVCDVRLDANLNIATVVSATNLLSQLLVLILSGGYSIEVQGYFFDR